MGVQPSEPVDGIQLAVDGDTSRCGLCAAPICGRESVGAFGLDGVICPHCAGNIVRYTPRCGYIGLPGGTTLALYQYHSHRDAAGGVLFAEPSTLLAGTHKEVIAYYQDLPARVQELIWWFAGDRWPPGFTMLDELAVNPMALQLVLDPNEIVEDQSDSPGDSSPVRTAVKRLPRPFLAEGTTIAIPDDDTSPAAVYDVLPARLIDSPPGAMASESVAVATAVDEGTDSDDEDTAATGGNTEQVGLGSFDPSELE